MALMWECECGNEYGYFSPVWCDECALCPHCCLCHITDPEVRAEAEAKMPSRLTWNYLPTEAGTTEALAPASFDPDQTWTVYKEDGSWRAKLGKRPIMNRDLVPPRSRAFDSLHAGKMAAEDLDARLAGKREQNQDE